MSDTTEMVRLIRHAAGLLRSAVDAEGQDRPMNDETPGRGVSGLETPLEGHPGPAELDLDAIRARADAATQGPWWAWDRGVGFEIAVGAPAEDGRPVDRLPDAMRTDIGRREDAEFIAAARTDVPALLDEIEALRSVVEAAAAIVALLKERGWTPQNEWFIPQTVPFVAAVEAWQRGGDAP